MRVPRAALPILSLAFLIASARGARATEPPKDWELEIAPYGWIPMINGSVDTQRFGREEFTITMGEVLSHFDLGFDGAVKARYRRWVAVVDIAWAKLSGKGDIGDTLVRYDINPFKIGWLQALGGYRVYERRGGLFGGANSSDEQIFGIDALVGISYVWTNLELDLHRNPIL